MLKRLSWSSWTTVVPVIAVVVLTATWGEHLGPVLIGLQAALLIGAVLAAVHHAEVVAARVGEPFGSLVLAGAVTVIEVALIVELMASGGNEAATLARDTAFAALMITTNGIAGLSLLLGSRRYGVTLFNAEGSGAALATLTTLATLSLAVPAFTVSHPGREFSPGQLIFVYPNSDAGGHALIERTRALAATRPHTHIFVNLDVVTYWSLLGNVAAMAGNSSSGIMEAASFALPTVNVGMRQQGRERARNIIDSPAEPAAIRAAIQRALSPEFRESLHGMENPYGNGTAAVTIARVLSTVPLDGLLVKQPTPLAEEQHPENS